MRSTPVAPEGPDQDEPVSILSERLLASNKLLPPVVVITLIGAFVQNVPIACAAFS
jgi:hypothetical protein